jgi:protein-tyrosine kinase
VLVLDSPPCLSTSDCSALAAVAGQVVLVVNAEKTLRNEVEAALDMLDACPLLQLLLNRVRLTVNDTFGARGDYGAANGRSA